MRRYISINSIIILILFSCKLPGSIAYKFNSNSNNGEVNTKTLLPKSIQISAKKYKDANVITTTSGKTAKDAAEKGANEDLVKKYSLNIYFEFEYNKLNKEIKVTETGGTSGTNLSKGQFIILSSELTNFISAVKIGANSTDTSSDSKAKGQFKADIIKNGEGNNANQDKTGKNKTITIIKGKDSDNTTKHYRFFDLAEIPNATSTTSSLIGIQGVFSYMIDNKDDEISNMLEKFKKEIEEYEKN